LLRLFSETDFADPDTDSRVIATIFGSLGTAVITLQVVSEATPADEQQSRVCKFVVECWPMNKGAVPADLHAYFAVRGELSTRSKVSALCDLYPVGDVLELAHEGHPGIVCMKQRCRESVRWPSIDRNIESFVRDCVACIASGKSARPVPRPLQPVPLLPGPWRELALDFVGEFNAAPSHQRYLLVAMDYYTKWPEAALCGSATSAAVIEFLTGLFQDLD
jgi:hypothetical protein